MSHEDSSKEKERKEEWTIGEDGITAILDSFRLY